MRRLIIVYNPNSSQYVHVQKEILDYSAKIKGFMVGKFAIEKASFESNVARLTKVLKDSDLVISAGGDATAAVCANAILESDKDITFAVLPYGNFNDLARTLGTKTIADIFHSPKIKKLYPLDVIVDGEHWRYATCYVTIGMTAASVKIFNSPKIRKKMKQGHKSSWRSYFQLSKWYFKNRHKKQFIPNFSINGKPQHPKTSDYTALSGRSMCRVMKGGEDYLKPLTFRSGAVRLISFPRLFLFMARSILHRVPGSDTKGDVLEFAKPSTVLLQAEGEYSVFKNTKCIEIHKTNNFIKVISANT